MVSHSTHMQCVCACVHNECFILERGKLSVREYNMVEQKVTHVHKQWAHALNVHIEI